MRKIFASMLLAAALTSAAQDPWLHIYYPKGSDYQGFKMSDIIEITFDDTTGSMSILTEDKDQTVYGSRMDFFRFGPNVARLNIEILDDPDLFDVESKTEYLDAVLYFEGRGHQDDYEVDVRVRGRGNSTWSYSKKPYRLKFSEKQRLLLPKKAKNYVLLANYIDGSMMRNFSAFKFGEIIDMPWVNHAEPVDVYFNGNYKGSYMLTEKVGFNNGSVNIKAADEPNSIMLEFDTNGFSYNSFTGQLRGPEDDIWFCTVPFHSMYNYIFPVTVKDPDAPEDPVEQQAWVNMWKADIDELMDAVADNDVDRMYQLCDLESLVKYIMVFNFCCNQEIDHPKSVYLYKTKGGKWTFGPCWDFDWAFGYRPTYENIFTTPDYENPLLGIGIHNDALDGAAGYFFYTLCNTPQFKARFEELWQQFLDSGEEQFWADFDTYAEALRPSAGLQGLSRSQYSDFETNIETLRNWIKNRIAFISSDSNHGLWRDGDFDKY